MPTYDYRCAKCGEDLEVFQTFAEAPLTKHKGCGGKLAKVLSPAGIVLKGSGFYKTDNRSSGRSGKESNGKGDSGSGGTSTTTSTESKSAGSESSGSSDKKSGSDSGSGKSADTKKPAAKTG
jgi:putative FmdB family regulatory protein